MGSMKRYLQFVKPYWKEITLTMIIGIVKFGIPLLLPLLLKYVVDDLLLSSLPAQDKIQKLMWVMLAALFVFTVIRIPVEYFRQYFAQWTASKVLFDIRNKLFDHIQKLSLRYYQNHKVGQIISRVIHDVEQTKEFVITGMMNIWLDLSTLLDCRRFHALAGSVDDTDFFVSLSVVCHLRQVLLPKYAKNHQRAFTGFG